MLLKVLSIFACLASLQIASANSLPEATQLYQMGNYKQALNMLQRIPPSGTKEYLTGRIFFKLQDFPEAIRHFRLAEQMQDDSPALYYELGQALYANKDLAPAREAFKRSIVRKYKVGASAYYVGFVSQLMEDNKTANDYYLRIQRLFNDFDNVQQPALLQIAEIAYIQTETIPNLEERKAVYKSNVLPLYRKAKNHTPKTSVAEQASARITEIELKISGEAIRMRNGMPLPLQPYSLKLSQDAGYNSNITTQADNALVEITDKDSFYFKTGINSKYQFNFLETFSVIPEFVTNFTWHSRRLTRQVYQNDNWVIAPAVRTKFEHWLGATPATGLFDIEYNLMLRDYRQQHSLPYYSRYWNFILGERSKLFPIGTTTIKLSMKFYENYNPERNALSPALSLTQNVRIGERDLSNTFTFDYLRARNDLNDEQNFKLVHSMEFSSIMPKVDFTPTLTWSAKDTMKQKGTRGIEILINPTLALNYNYSENWNFSAEYGLSKNFSRAKSTYQYTQHDIKFGALYDF